MRSHFLHLSNTLNSFLPSTRFFGLKRRFLRICGARIGAGVSLNMAVHVLGRGDLMIGEGSWIGVRNLFIIPAGAKIEIGSHCDVAPDVIFECGSHEIGGPTRRAGRGTAASISVGDGCWIGTRALLLGGAVVGQGCVIAAGAVVLPGTYPANSLLAGVPARIVKSLPMDTAP